ncbi:MAG: RloB family protein, partial [Candidatus Cloacimonadaceae bacterium]
MAKSRRKVNTRQIPPDLILIVCEGEKTEPCYFECFPLHTKKIAIIKGTGTSTLALINETDKELQKAKKWYFDDYGIHLKDKDIVVWCVFDYDDAPDDQFDNAIHSARAKNYRVAYSNEAFELWYWLHFDYVNTGVSRNEYKSRLSKRLGFEYQKNNPKIYQ